MLYLLACGVLGCQLVSTTRALALLLVDEESLTIAFSLLSSLLCTPSLHKASIAPDAFSKGWQHKEHFASFFHVQVSLSVRVLSFL